VLGHSSLLLAAARRATALAHERDLRLFSRAAAARMRRL
jgi:hypothetical protein